jgi:uncharacterized membrane-anchored protein YjiN (DUF445 family)
MKTIPFIVLVALLASCGTLSPVARYNKEHKDKTFEYAMANNPQFTLASAKDDLREAKKADKKADKLKSDLAKVEAINKQIQELKNDNQ